MFNFMQIFIFKPDFGPIVVFLGLSPPSWASRVIRTRCLDDSDQSGKVRIRVLDSDPATQQLYFDANAKFKCGCVPYGTECGPGCRCRVRSPLLCGTAPYYGTGARADAWIWTSVRIRVSILKPGTVSFFLLLFIKPQTARHHQLRGLKNIFIEFF